MNEDIRREILRRIREGLVMYWAVLLNESEDKEHQIIKIWDSMLDVMTGEQICQVVDYWLDNGPPVRETN